MLSKLSQQRFNVPKRSYGGEYLLWGLMKYSQCGAAVFASKMSQGQAVMVDVR